MLICHSSIVCQKAFCKKDERVIEADNCFVMITYACGFSFLVRIAITIVSNTTFYVLIICKLSFYTYV